MKISEELERFCYDSIYELANAYNSTLSAGIEHEEGFNQVADRLGISQKAKEDIFSKMLYFSEVAGIPYHELSPINQFIVSIPPYIIYCIENKIPDDSSLKEEATKLVNNLVDNNKFYRYLQEKIGISIAQEIKGALWKPSLFGLGKVLDSITGLRYKKSRKEGEQADAIIRGLNLILETLFITLLDIYESKFPTDIHKTNLMRAGTILNELVKEELRGEQNAFKDNNKDFINRETIRLLKLERIRKGILSFLAAKGAFYQYMNSPKSIIWVKAAEELEPEVIIPDSLDRIIEVINKYLLEVRQGSDYSKA